MIFIVTEVFLGCRIPRNIGVSIPMKAIFFITYIMVDGWVRIASKILRLKPLVIFHLNDKFIVKTERDLEKAMNPGGVDFPETLNKSSIVFPRGNCIYGCYPNPSSFYTGLLHLRILRLSSPG
ncbi:CSC1-like protein [Abeliophyllum distichum]|uniref:CSC1-like protein n=1 Tax=Abeliophyllum distichum TaxID=126358 RepID=A0ABD1UTC1_9LAMI